jgi:glycosyltransferase involved in cell wall biosynthesis
VTIVSHPVLINGVFLSQGLSGQQRYAREISSRLPQEMVSIVEPPALLRRYGATRHIWTNLEFARREVSMALSLTHQVPLRKPKAAHEVAVIHDLFPITNPEWFSSKYQRLAAMLLQKVIDRADHLIAVSEVTATAIQELAPRGPQISVAPNAPSAIFVAKRCEEIDSTVLRDFGLSPRGFVLTMASDDPRKRIDVVRDGLMRSELRDLPLAVVGNAPSTSATGSPNRAARVTNEIHLGRVSDERLAILFGNCLAFVTASDGEGFGLPCVEAAAAGATVVASDLPIHRWTLGDYPSFFRPADPDSLADAFNELRSGEGHDPWKTYACPFSWDESASVVARVIGSLT